LSSRRAEATRNGFVVIFAFFRANVSPRRQNIIVFLNLFQFHGSAEARRVYIILARFAILPPSVICVRNLRNVSALSVGEILLANSVSAA
jgi:hypothetical protein